MILGNWRDDDYLLRFFEGESNSGSGGDSGNGGGGSGDGGSSSGGAGGAGSGNSGASGGDGDDDDDFDPKAAKDLIRTLRKSERDLKKSVTNLQGKVSEFENANKSDLEKAQQRADAAEKRASELEAKVKAAEIRGAVADAARSSGAIYPDDVYALIQDKIEIGAEGSPSNVQDLIKDLRTSRPALFGRPSNGDGASGKGRTPQSDDVNTMIRRAAGRA